MTPTPLRDRLLFLEARLALVEDQAAILRRYASRRWRDIVAMLEVGALYLVLWIVAQYGPRGPRTKG